MTDDKILTNLDDQKKTLKCVYYLILCFLFQEHHVEK